MCAATATRAGRLDAGAARRLLAGLGLAATAAAAPAQGVGNTASLAFGSFIAGSGGAVTVSPAGQRSRGGSVVLVAQGTAAEAAQFIVSGPAHAVVAITLPPDGMVSLFNAQGQALAVKAFVSNPSGSTALSAAGSGRVSVGATLVVGAGQPTGAYAGSFSLTVNYN